MNGRQVVTILGTMLFSSAAFSDCGGTGTCCQEDANRYICRGALITQSSLYTAEVPAIGRGSMIFTFTPQLVINQPTNCTLYASCCFSVTRERPGYDQAMILVSTAEFTGSVVDVTVTAEPKLNNVCAVSSITLH